jgi:hypothetical protein
LRTFSTHVYSSLFLPAFLGGGGGARFILEMGIFPACWELPGSTSTGLLGILRMQGVLVLPRDIYWPAGNALVDLYKDQT